MTFIVTLAGDPALPSAFSTLAANFDALVKSKPTAKYLLCAKPLSASKPEPAEKRKLAATSKCRQTTQGWDCMDPRATF